MIEAAAWHGLTTGIVKLALGFVVFLASTVVFDAIHWALHDLSGSRWAVLRRIGALHAAHHAFLPRELRHDEAYLGANIRQHVIPEFFVQLSVSGLLLLFLPVAVVGTAIFLQVLLFGLIMKARGKDINHVAVDRVAAYRPMYFCTPPYHRLHHVYPDAYFSSWIKTFDHLLGTGADLRVRSIAMVGGGGDFGAALRRELEAQRGELLVVLDDEKPDLETLAATDIIVLAGEPTRFDEHLARIEGLIGERRLPVEVWAVAPESDGTFEHRGRKLYTDPRIIYRHIAGPPRNGTAATKAARVAFFFIRRGFNWVPSRLSPDALRRYLRFRALTEPSVG